MRYLTRPFQFYYNLQTAASSCLAACQSTHCPHTMFLLLSPLPLPVTVPLAFSSETADLPESIVQSSHVARSTVFKCQPCGLAVALSAALGASESQMVWQTERERGTDREWERDRERGGRWDVALRGWGKRFRCPEIETDRGDVCQLCGDRLINMKWHKWPKVCYTL